MLTDEVDPSISKDSNWLQHVREVGQIFFIQKNSKKNNYLVVNYVVSLIPQNQPVGFFVDCVIL